MRRINTRGASSGRCPVGLKWFVKPALALALLALSGAANAVTVLLAFHNQTSSSGTISTLITDGSQVNAGKSDPNNPVFVGPTTAVWDWDGTTLNATGLYTATGSIGSSPFSAAILSDEITNLSINTSTSTATATSYKCIEGNFLGTVGASGCGGYNLGTNFTDESTTIWGPGLAVSQTLGGDDVLTGGAPRDITSYDFALNLDEGTNPGDLVRIGTAMLPGGVAVGTPGGEEIVFRIPGFVVDDNRSVPANTTFSVDVLANDTVRDEIKALSISAAPAKGTATVINAEVCTPVPPATDCFPSPQADLTIDYQWDPGQQGTDTFQYTVNDAIGPAATATVTITNQLPVAVDDTAGTLVDTPVDIDVLANDTLGDAPDSIVDVTSAPSNGTVAPMAGGTLPVTCTAAVDCSLTYTPALGFLGTDGFTYSLTDANGDVVTANVSITVSDQLSAIDDAAATDKNTPVVIDVLGNDVGLVFPPFSVNVTATPSKGTITTVLPVTCPLPGTACALSYTPNLDQLGNDTFIYQVTDSDTPPNTSSATVTVFLNDLPVAVDDAASSLPTAVTQMPTTLDVQANDTGLTDAPITISVVTPPANGMAVPDAGNPQQITYTSNPAFNGVDTFTYQLTDARGTGSTGDTSNTATVSVNVHDQPVAVDDSFTAPNTGVAATLDVQANDTGLTEGPITVSVVGNPANGMAVPDAGNPQQVVYTSTQGFIGMDSFTYRLQDSNGDTSNVATVDVAVTDPSIPLAVDDVAGTFPDEMIGINVLSNDAGLADTPLVVSITSNPTNGTLGTVTGCDQQATCVVPYTPNTGYIGPDSFRYTITDSTLILSNEATVDITVNEVPVAVDDTAELLDTGGPVTIDVLANDSGLANVPLAVTIKTPPASGTATVQADNTIVYAATGSAGAADQFEYVVTDGNGRFATALVTVKITQTELRAVADFASTFSGEMAQIDVLANDMGLSNASLTVSVKQPANGTIKTPVTSCKQEGAFCAVSYTPNAGFVGVDSFEYQVNRKTTSTDVDSNFATVTVTVAEVPVAKDDAASTTVSGSIAIDVLANDGGKSNTPLSVTVTGDPDPAKGTAVVQPDNTIVYTSTGSQATTDTFDYTVTDANNKSSTARVTVTIDEDTTQSRFKSSSSAMGPVGLGLLLLVPWLRRRRRGS